MKVFITGANGYLGAKIYEYLSALPQFEVQGGFFGPNDNERLALLDISDAEQTRLVFEKFKPEAVVHVAAVAHGEDSYNTALLEKVNVQGTKNVVEANKENRSKMIYLSSVGALHDIPYGKSKLAGEDIVRNSGLEYLVIRPSVIVGLSPNQGSDLTFNKILDAIKKGGTVEEDEAWKFQPTWINHVCDVVELWLEGKFKDAEPVYPIVPQVKTRFEISNDILRHFGLSARPVRKPRYEEDTILSTDSLTRNNLPVYHYDYVLERLVEEIKDAV